MDGTPYQPRCILSSFYKAELWFWFVNLLCQKVLYLQILETFLLGSLQTIFWAGILGFFDGFFTNVGSKVVARDWSTDSSISKVEFPADPVMSLVHQTLLIFCKMFCIIFVKQADWVDFHNFEWESHSNICWSINEDNWRPLFLL